MLPRQAFRDTLEPIAGGTNDCSAPLRARKEKLDAIGDPRIKYARTPGDREQAAQFDLRRSVALFLFWVKRCVWISDLHARVRYLFEPAEIDRYAGLVSTCSVAEVAPESLTTRRKAWPVLRERE